MPKIGLVVLNFITYSDTYELIVSLKNNSDYYNFIVYIVDNKTEIDKYRSLQNKILSLQLNFQIVYLSSKDNLGFAKGMNIGINEAKRNDCSYIICSNNDIVYNKRINFKKFTDIYIKDKSIAVIGPKILNPDMINQNPYIIYNRLKTDFLSKLKQKLVFSNFLGKYIFFIRGILKNMINKNSHIQEKLDSSQYIYCLHGSYFVLTPVYFNYYKDLDPNTFLYVEELILAERVKSKKLKEYYYNEMEVFHKDDSSTNEMLGKDSLKKTLFVLNENYKSLKYFMKEYVWN